MRRRFVPALAVAILVLALIAGITQLFALRMEGGDVYPRYSTLRADPLGAKVFAEALSELPGLEVRRSFRVPARAEKTAATWFFLGVERSEFEARKSLPEGVALGSRAVFTFVPSEAGEKEARKPRAAKPAPRSKKNESAKPGNATPAPAKGGSTPAPGKDENRDEPEERSGAVDLGELWGVKVLVRPGKKYEAFNRPAELQAKEFDLEPQVPWHSATYFAQLVPAWRVIYSCQGEPVLIQRPWGDGAVVLASDSVFLSNEALRGESLHAVGRTPKLLAWLAGANRRIVFDEEHHGIREQPGVASLIRKYRLEGVIAGLVLLMLLFAWQQAQPFNPGPVSRREGVEVVSGRSAGEGLITLLRRSIPAGKLLEICLSEWKKSGAGTPPERARLEAAWASVEASAGKEKAVVQSYRALAAALRPGTRAALPAGESTGGA
jgi:hypothetical protein